MNNKIKNYVEVLFSNIPRSRKANELKEELLSNMSDRFEDYIKEGKTENQAYTQVISNLGDVDEMLADVMPGDDFVKEANFYRKRNAKNTAIGVAMYIIGAAFLIGLGGLGDYLGNGDVYAIIGLLILLVLSAIATSIIVYSHMSTPLEYKDFNQETKQEFKNLDSKQSRLLEGIQSILWITVTFIYLMVSFFTGAWGITWIIWIFAAIIQEIIKTIFEMRYSHD